MNPDQMEQSDLGPYCLEYRLPRHISMIKVVFGGKWAMAHRAV